MYSNKMAAAIKVNNRVLREFDGDKVYVPFNSEYQISLKNLNSRRAIVHIDIDGVRVTGDGLVVRANQSIDLERFIDNGNLESGNKFKFIERTNNVERARGIFVEDGLVRIEFEYEQMLPQINWDSAMFRGAISKSADAVSTTWLSNTSYGGSDLIARGNSTLSCSASASATSYSAPMPQNDVGITVKGSVSDQKFHTTSFTGDGVKEVMVLKLLGETENGKVEQPITVKAKPKCTTCHHMNKATAKFCSECGTSLIIV
jgi:hypothetical protein